MYGGIKNAWNVEGEEGKLSYHIIPHLTDSKRRVVGMWDGIPHVDSSLYLFTLRLISYHE